jgi:asparagine synthase (glutamine-hydrolysing)
MSGICGVLNLDGAPIIAHELERLTAFLDFRGPDARHQWIGGEVGLGHTLLRTTSRLEAEHQPLSLDGEVWITADARIDGQAELRRKLKASCREVPATAHDAALILHAYCAWGEECTGHLIGDFAFAIWDGRRKRLFCARDHFGVKPFFYALVGNCLLFSNTLNCVRCDPAVASRLNELTIADFLLFESNQDPETTAFSDVRRLAPAHCLTVGAEGLKTRRYWSLPYDARVQYRGEGEYVERFRELLDCAVADRIGADRVALTLSGGLDSAGIAATAKALRPHACAPVQLRGYTAVYDSLIPDEERVYSGMVSQRLGIPISYLAVDGYQLYERYDALKQKFPEPVHDPLAAIAFDLSRDAAAYARVVLTGYDGDALLSESPRAYFASLLQNGSWGRLLSNSFAYAVAEGRLVPTGALKRLNPWARKSIRATGEFPAWLNPDFVHRLKLRERFEDAASNADSVAHPIRPRAFRIFESIMRRSNFFESSDPGCTGSLVEYRHPLMDVRLLEHCLSLPPYPWCVGKEILRRSLRGMLPEPVRTRPKTPLAGFPHHELLKQQHSRWVDEFAVSQETSAFVERAKIPSACAEADPQKSWTNLRPLSLELWLRNLNTPVVH